MASNEPFLVQSLDELRVLLLKIENSEFPFVMNEFGVTEIHIVIELDFHEPLVLSSSDSFNFEFYSSLLDRIASLTEYTLTFQPVGYSDSNVFFNRVPIMLGTSLLFYGFTRVSFLNIQFNVMQYFVNDDFTNYQNYWLPSFLPGLYFSSVENIEIKNCSIVSAKDTTYHLIDLNVVNDFFKFQSLQFFLFYFEILGFGKLSIESLEIGLEISYPENFSHPIYDLISQLPIFNISAKSALFSQVFIGDCDIDKPLFHLKIMVEIVLSKFYINSTLFRKASFLALITNQTLVISEFIFCNLTITEQNLFIIQGFGFLIANQLYFTKCSFQNYLASLDSSFAVLKDLFFEITNIIIDDS